MVAKRRLRSKTPTVKHGKYKGYDIHTVLAIAQQKDARGARGCSRVLDLIEKYPMKYVGSVEVALLVMQAWFQLVLRTTYSWHLERLIFFSSWQGPSNSMP